MKKIEFEIIIHRAMAKHDPIYGDWLSTVGWKARIDGVQYGNWMGTAEMVPSNEAVTAIVADFIEAISNPTKLDNLKLFEGQTPVKVSSNEELAERAKLSIGVIYV